jgi:non-canonical (house-cleaning) NTP pyrophosphatase
MNIYFGTTSSIKKHAIETVVQDFILKKLLEKPVLHFEKIDQPLSVTPLGKQTYLYSKKRAEEMFSKFKDTGNFFVGVENGLIQRFGRLYEECWCYIIDKNKNIYTSYSSGLALPSDLVNEMKQGGLHHEILTKKHGEHSRQTWGSYTNNIIQREESIKEAFRNTFYYAITA